MERREKAASPTTESYQLVLREFEGQRGSYALFQAGEAARRIGDRVKAEHCFKSSLAQARNERDKSSIAKAFWGLATLRRSAGRTSAAIETYLMAAAWAAEAGSVECLNWARAGHAEIIRHQGQHNAAVERHTQLLDCFRRNGDTVGELWALQGIGQIHLVNHSTKTADEFFQRAEDRAFAIGDRRVIAFSRRALAISARRRGDLSAARSLLAESLAIFQNIGYAVGVGFALQELAHCQIVEGEFHEARRLVSDALHLFGDGFPLGRAWTLTTQAQIEKETGGPSQLTLARSARIFSALGVTANLDRPQVRYSRRYHPVGANGSL